MNDLVRHWPSPIKNTSQVPSAVSVYRHALAAQPDHSVAIASIGLLTNIQNLLQSEPDAHSPLSGLQLVALKVKHIVVMGGAYPSSGTGPRGCNFCGCVFGNDPVSARAASAAAAYAVAQMPSDVRMIFLGGEVGKQVQTGSRLSTCATPSNPCRQAYLDYLGGSGRSRYSWDPLTTLVAVRGVAAAGCAECTDCDGVNRVDSNTGANAWVGGTPLNQTYLVMKDATFARNTIDDLLCQAV